MFLQSITVSELNEKIKSLLETTFAFVSVEGEISRPTYHTSGHIYFTLKDKESAISCVMFRGNQKGLKFRLEEGQKVVVHGGVSVYKPRGEYQINCLKIEPSGIGALALAYEQLKKRLSAKGYFDESRKKSLPKFPKTIVLVTSKTGAALQDMLRVATKRWPLVKIILLNTLVQGEGAAEDIARNIAIADTLGADVIVVARGGGSLEDLWAFNEEIVADAIFLAKTPIVSAVGHEIDFLISDLVADLRAPTPSAAMEMVLPDKSEMFLFIDHLSQELARQQERQLRMREDWLLSLVEQFNKNSIEVRMAHYEKELLELKDRMNQTMEFLLEKRGSIVPDLAQSLKQFAHQQLFKKSHELAALLENFKSQDPALKGKKGFAQIVKEGMVVSLEQIDVGDLFELQTSLSVILAKAVAKRELCPTLKP